MAFNPPELRENDMAQAAPSVQKISLLALQKPLEETVTWLERLTPRSVRLIEKIASMGLIFSDPFGQVRGVDEAVARFERRLAAFGGSPKFTVTDRAVGRGEEGTAYLRWRMTGIWRGKDISIDGVAELMFAPDGKLVVYIDHWDASPLYANSGFLARRHRTGVVKMFTGK